MYTHSKKHSKIERIFTASEVAEYEHCSLQWWYERYDPLTQADNEDLFAHLVAMENEHGAQATAIPDYIVVEQLLLRRGAFEAEYQAPSVHQEEDESAAQMQAEHYAAPPALYKLHQLQLLAVGTLTLALFVLLVAWISMSLPVSHP